MLPLALLAPLVLLGGGRDAELKAELARLQAQVTVLEAENVALRAELSACEGRPTPEQEAAATGLSDRARLAMEAGDAEGARALYRQLATEYPDTRSARASARTLAELEVLGTALSPSWQSEVLRWFQGEGAVDLSQGVTVVVFFEEWCPHCKRELPQLQELQDRTPGLQVLGLTRITKSSTPDSVSAFIAEFGLRFPIAQEDGDLTSLLAVTGIPAAAVVQDGVVVWRGHPARLTDEALAGWLGRR